MLEPRRTSNYLGNDPVCVSAELGLQFRVEAKVWSLPHLDGPVSAPSHPAPELHLRVDEDGVVSVAAKLDNRVVISARPEPEALPRYPRGFQLELPWPEGTGTEAEAMLRSWVGRNYEPLALARSNFGLTRLPPERLMDWAAIAGCIASWMSRHGNLCRLVVARWMASEQADELLALLRAEAKPRAALAYLGLPREAWLLRVIGKLPLGVELRPHTQLLADLAHCAGDRNKRKQLCHLPALNTTAVALVARAEGRLRLTPALFGELAGGAICGGLRSRLERDLDLLCTLMPRSEPIGSDEELRTALDELDMILLRNERNHGHRGPRPPAFGLRFDAQRLLPPGFVQLRTRSAIWREGNAMGHCLGRWGLNSLDRARVVYAHAEEPVPATLALLIDAQGRPWLRDLRGRFNAFAAKEMKLAVEDHLASVRKRSSTGIRAGRERLREALRSAGLPDWLARLSTREPRTSVNIDWADPVSAAEQLPMSEAWLRPLRSVVDMHLRSGHGYHLTSAVAPAAVHGRVGPDRVPLADYVGRSSSSGPVHPPSELVNYHVAEHQATPAFRTIGFELLVGPNDWREHYAVRPIDPATCTDFDVYAALEQLRHVATPNQHPRPGILLALQDCVALTGSFFHAFDGDHGIPRIYEIDVHRCSGLEPEVLEKLARLPDPRRSVSSLEGILDLPQVGKDELLAMVRSEIFGHMKVRAERVASFQEELQSVADSSDVRVYQELDGGGLRVQVRNEDCSEIMTEISAERLWALLHGFEKVSLWSCDLPAGVWSTVADAPVKSLQVSFLRPPLASDLEAIATLPHLEDLTILVEPPC